MNILTDFMRLCLMKKEIPQSWGGLLLKIECHLMYLEVSIKEKY